MAVFDVYLELNPAGYCMAHVPALPGCMTRAESQEAALTLLPQAILDYQTWLDPRQISAIDPAGITLAIVETNIGSGPFEPNDMAALFKADTLLLSQEETAGYYLQLADKARRDLLALTSHLPDNLLDWQATTHEMTIRAILRHIGNAEQWYLSRLVDPMTLPPEWDDDQGMPIFEFLAMEQRTSTTRWQQLTVAELNQIYYPIAWTDHPEEGWTGRKALRRLLEHHFEHIAQIRQILAQWRHQYLLELAEARLAILEQLVGLNEEMLNSPVFDSYTAKDLMAHIAAWDGLHTERMALVCSGRAAELNKVDLNEHNEQLYAHYRERPLEEVITIFTGQRENFLKQLADIDEGMLHRPVKLPWNDEEVTIRVWAMGRIRHDKTHTADLRQWREQNQFALTNGPKSLLLAALKASRTELLALAGLFNENELLTRPLIGDWPFKNVLGHIADWEAYCLDCLRSGRVLDRAYGGDFQLWNEAHNLTRQQQSWEEVLADANHIRQEWLAFLTSMTAAEFLTPLTNPWGRDSTPYGWSLSFLEHEREHVTEIRATLNMNA